MGDIIGGEYRTSPRTFTTTGQYGNCQIDEHGRLLVSTATEDANSELITTANADTVTVLAAPTGSEDGLGKLAATLANTEVIYVRYACPDLPYSNVDWIVSHAQQADLVYYKAQSIVDEVTLTLADIANTETFLINGLTYTAATAGVTVLASGRKFPIGDDDTADAANAVKIINADYSVVTAGTSVAATDKLVITTDEGAHTIVAKATSASYTTGQYLLNSTQATELASIILAINHTQNVTCASAQAGDTVTINGLVFTGHATTTTEANREWDIADDNAAAAALVTCINDATYGVPGVTASATGATVYLYRDSEDDSITLTSSNATRLACVTTVGGVPGVTAVATGASGELTITPTWTSVLTVTEAGDRLTVTDIDNPGIYATSAEGVITLVPGGPASQDEDAYELATVISAVTGTAAGHCAVSQAATLAGLMIDTASGTAGATANEAATTGTAGTIHTQAIAGYPYCYLGLTADNATPQAVSVSVKPRL